MLFLDVFGPPGVGKSALLDEWWPPRGIPYDGLGMPFEWADFLGVTARMLEIVRDHPTFGACKSMTERSFRKMATIHRRQDPRIYIQTGLAQRGLGFGWRMADPEQVRPYFEVMPVSLGCVLLHADAATIQERNRTRRPVKDRSHMVPLMARPCEIAVEVLRARGVPVLELDTREPIDRTRARLREFAESRSATPAHA